MARGRHLTIDNQRYLLSPTKNCLKSLLRNQSKFNTTDDFILVTSVSWDKSTFTKNDLEDVCHQYNTEDDVWCREFLSLVILLRNETTKCETSSKRIVSINNSKARLLVGPLAIEKSTGNVFLVSRLYNDTHHAFVSSIKLPARNKSVFYEYSRSEEVSIPVPSRLYYPRATDKPLNGLRVAVKDTIALKGLCTSFGSKAWLDVSSAETFTAPCIQRLVDAGAIIVGKVKTTEFAEGVDASEWLDTICPFNPRGDGEQQTSSSSTGSASAVASYCWLDVSIGTDTGGSIRHPASVNGCFGQRPSTGSMDLTGVLGATDLFNTVGVFARDVKTFCEVGGYMVENPRPEKPELAGRKFNLLYPTRAAMITSPDQHHHGQHRWFPHPEVDPSSWTDAEKCIDSTVCAIEKLLNCKRIPFNINELWNATPVIGLPKNLDEAVGSIYSTITTSSALHTGIDQFITDYEETHNGAQPPMANVVKARLDHGRKVTTDDIAKALHATHAFKDWTENVLFGSYDQDATTLLIFPQTCGRPDYRGKTPQRKELFNDTFSIYAFGYLVGCPDYTLPVAEVPYLSEGSGKTEYLPTSISLVGRPGTDTELFDIVEYLHENKALSDIMAGKRMFHDSDD